MRNQSNVVWIVAQRLNLQQLTLPSTRVAQDPSQCHFPFPLKCKGWPEPYQLGTFQSYHHIILANERLWNLVRKQFASHTRNDRQLSYGRRSDSFPLHVWCVCPI